MRLIVSSVLSIAVLAATPGYAEPSSEKHEEREDKQEEREAAKKPGPFQILTPSGAGKDATPAASWTPSEHARHYEVTIGADAKCKAVVQKHEFVKATTVELHKLKDGAYFICVEAEHGEKHSVFATNNGLPFSIATVPPGAFAVTAPTGTSTNALPTIVWGASSGARKYDLTVATDAGCTTAAASAANLTTTSYPITTPLAAGTYYPCVTARDAAGNSTPASTNGIARFTIAPSAPGAFFIAGPSGTVTDAKPLFSWSAATGATAYDVTIANDAQCASPVQHASDLTTTSFTPAANLADGTYHTCVTAKNSGSTTTAAGNNGLAFTVNATPPGSFQINGPAGTVTTSRPPISWTVSSHATKYDLIISTTAGCTSAVQSAIDVTTTTYTPSTALADGAYYTCVTAKSDGGLTTTASNNGLSFTVSAAPPGSFNVLGPTGTSSNKTPSVTWSAADRATKYDLVIATDSACGSAAQAAADLIQTSYAVTAPLADGTYYLCVTAKTDSGATTAASNNGLSFTVKATPPGAFTVAGPTGTLTLNKPTVTWSASTGATKYELAIGTDAACSVPAVSATDLTSTAYTVASALADGTYYTCVTAKDDTGNSTPATNNGLSFIVTATPPGAFTITAPTGLSNKNQPAIMWTTAARATKYDLTVAADAACSVVVQTAKGLTNTTYAMASALADGTYYSCVTAKTDAGLTTLAANNGLTFTIHATPPAAFSILGPTGTSSVKQPTVAWNAASGASKYDVLIASDAACSVAIQSATNITTTSFAATALADGTYFSCVTAKDDAGNLTSAGNSGLAFTVKATPPGAFQISGPTGLSNNGSPTISWTAASTATKYDLTIAADAACATPLLSAASLPTTSYAVASPLADGTYYSCVTAKDAAGNATAAGNNGLSFAVKATPPGSFTITSPNGLSNNNKPVVAWAASTSASRYDMKIASDSACANVVQSATNLTTTSYAATALADGTYFTCVTAKDDAGNGTTAANNGLRFAIKATPPAPFSIGGPTGLTNSSKPTVTWSASATATSYSLTIAADAACAVAVQSASALTATAFAVPSTLADGAYYSCVTAKDDAGNSTVASNNGLSFAVKATPPGAFQVAGPTGLSNNASPTISWSAAATATKYDLTIASDAACATAVQSAPGLTATSYAVSTPLTDGIYYSCVTAKDAAGNATAATNNGLAFSVKATPPGSFSITAPTGTVYAGKPTITWGAASTATKYDLTIASNATCSAAVQTATGLAATAFAVATSLADGTYYLCVLAKDDAGNSTSALNNGTAFTVNTAPPGTFVLNAPNGPINTNKPTFSWSAAGGATKYDLIVATDAACTVAAQSILGVSTTSYMLTTALADGTYYACVTAQDNGGVGTPATNNGLSFTVKTVGPGAFIIAGPSGISNNNKPTVTWSASNGASKYDVRIASDAACSTAVQSATGLATTSFPAATPLPDGSYYTCVIAKDDADNATPASNGGLAFTVKTVPPAAFAIAGPAGASNNNKPTVSWTVATGASTYNLTVATDAACVSTIQSASSLTTTSYALVTPLADGSYYTCVTAKDDAGNTIVATNNGFGFSIKTVPPATFTVSGPAGPGNNNKPTVTWSAATGATKYDVRIASDSACVAVVQTVTNVVVTSYAASALADGSYYTCVTAKDDAGNSTNASNNGLGFTIKTVPPASFAIAGPSGLSNNNKPSIAWTAAAGATKYDVKITTDAGCANGIRSATDLTTTIFAITTALADGTYYSCVTAKDDAGNTTSATNNGLSFAVKTTPPAAFTIAGPSGLSNNNKPMITWAAAAGAATYDVKIASEAACATAVQSATGVASTSYGVPTALADGVYYTCVTAKDNAGNAANATNNGLTFTVKTVPPATFTIAGPTGISSNSKPVIAWAAAAGATSYSLVIGSDAACATAVQSTTGLTGTSNAVTTSLADGTYYSCVTAKDDAGNSTIASNNGLSFTVKATPPGAFAVVGPTGLSNNNKPTISWSASVTATKYDLTIATDAACAAVVQSALGLPVTSYSGAVALADGTYYSCVTAKDDAGNTTAAANNGLAFTIKATPPGAFQIAGPTGLSNVAKPVISWSAATSATKYDLRIAADAGCATSVQSALGLSTTTFPVTSALADGTYYSCVTARDDAGNATTASNNALSFTIATVPPGAFAIAGPTGVSNNTLPTVTWGAAAGATSYDAKITTDAACTTGVRALTGLTATTFAVTTALPDGVYYACVTAKDNAGNATNASNNGLGFTVKTVPPGGFTVSGPIGPTNNNKPTITWTASMGAFTYDLRITSDPACTSAIQSATGITASSYGLATALTDGVFYTCVTAKDDAGNMTAASNSGLAFTVKTVPPGAFTIASPSGSINNNRPSVAWSLAATATKYDLAIGADAACYAPVQTASGVTSRSYLLTSALADGTYYVCITARDDAGNSTAATNNGLSFTVDTTPPGAFTLTGPTGLSNNNKPSAAWTAAAGASSYDLKIGSDAACATVVQSATGLSTTAFAVTTALADGTYYLCVTAQDAAGNTTAATNNGLSFAVDATPPGAFAVLAPSGTSNNNKPTAAWGAAAGAATYDLKITSDAACTTVVQSSLGLSTTTFALTTALADGSYHTCVTAKDAAGNATAASNNGLAFVVDTTPPAAFQVVGPTGFTTGNKPTITWNAAAGASSYDLEISQSASCATAVQTITGLASTSTTLTTALADGPYLICVTAKDAAGNATNATNNGAIGFTVDTTAPTVTATTPAASASNVAASSTVAVTFSEVMKSSTITGSTFTVYGHGSPVSGSVTYTGQTATFTPSAALTAGWTYSVSVTSGATDLAGNALAANYLFNFTVANATWTGPLQLDKTNANAVNSPQIIAHALNGTSIVVWPKSNGSRFRIIANLYTPAGGWDAGTLIDNTSQTGNASAPMVTMNGPGSAAVTWVQSDSGNVAHVWVQFYNASTGLWGSATQVDSGTVSADSATVGMDDAGNTIVAWRQPTSGTSATPAPCWFARFVPGTGWSAGAKAETLANDCSAPIVRVDSAGNALLVFGYDLNGNKSVIQLNAARYTVGGSWSAPQAIASSAATVGTLANSFYLGMNRNGQAAAVWRQLTNGTNSNVWVNSFSTTSGWGTAAAVDNGVGTPITPHVDVDPSGNLVVVWAQGVTIPHIFSAHFNQNTGWSAPQQVDSAATNASKPQVSVNSFGDAMAVWQQVSSGSTTDIWASRFLADGTWSAAQIIDTPPLTAVDPQVSYTDYNKAFATWRQNAKQGATHGDIFVNTFQ